MLKLVYIYVCKYILRTKRESSLTQVRLLTLSTGEREN